VSKIGKSKQNNNGADKTQVVQDEPKCSILPHCKKARNCGLLQYFSYQSVSRIGTEAKTGNMV
jgi:hypothetical protein